MTNFFFYEINMNSAIINIVQKVCHTLAKQGAMVFCFTTLFGRLLYICGSPKALRNNRCAAHLARQPEKPKGPKKIGQMRHFHFSLQVYLI